MLLYALLSAFILIAVGLAWYFIKHDRGEREPVNALWVAVGFGFGGAIMASIIESILVPSNALKAGRPLGPLLMTALLIGVIEESCKFVPLSLFLYRKRYFNEHTDGIIYFALAGLGFGLPENILYTLQFGAGAGLGRIFLTPFFHAATTGMVGFFLAKSKVDKRPRRIVWLMLAVAMLLHGLYDFGLTSGNAILTLMSVAITFSLSIGLFVLYGRATELDKEEGLSVVGHNSFCRACGFPNPKHHLHCIHCGQYA
jgi:RsiW-degrading membrane proteinase PrsW (M82 family)